MSKIDTDILKTIIDRNEVEPRQVARIMEDVQNVLKQEQAEKDTKPPAIKKQFVVLVSDRNGALDGSQFVAWVLQIPEDDSPLTAADRIIQAVYDFNVTPKGRRLPVGTIGEACEALPARITKDHNVWIKTKEAVLVVTTDNAIPMENGGAL